MIKSFLLLILFSISVLFAEDSLRHESVPIRALVWYNAKADGAFGWFVFREDYTPIWYAFFTADGKTTTIDRNNDGHQLNINVTVELNPLGIEINDVDYGYSAKFTHSGKQINLSSIKTMFVKKTVVCLLHRLL